MTLREFLGAELRAASERADLPYSLRRPPERDLELGRASAFRDALAFLDAQVS